MAIRVRSLGWTAGFCLAAVALWSQEDPSAKPKDEPKEEAAGVIERIPAITSVLPQSGRPGRTVELNVRGEFLDGVNRVEFESPDVSGVVIASTYTSAKIKVTIPPNAEPGQRYFRLLSPRGATNLLVFRLSKLPQFLEQPGGNGELEHAMPVTVPALVSGALHADMGGMYAAGDEADLYRFHAKKGQRIQFNLFGVRSLGTRAGLPQLGADLSLTLMRADGHQLMWDEGRFVWDPYIDYTFEEEGDYIAAVTVTRGPTTVVLVFPRYEPAAYTLAMGAAPHIWTVYPAGAQRGREVELEMRADFMPAKPKLILNSHGLDATIQKTPEPGVFKLKVRSAADASIGMHHISVQDESGTTAPVRFMVGEFPELMEAEPNDSREQAQTLAWPVTVNGRMDRRADHDWYRIEVKPDQKLVFTMDAESVGGSKMDPTLTLTDAKGKQLKYVDDGIKVGGSPAANRDPVFTYAFKEGGVYYLDVASSGRQFGPEQIYRLTVHEPQPDFGFSLPGAYRGHGPLDRFRVPKGGKVEIPLQLGGIDDFEGEVKVEVKGLPKGVTATPTVVTTKKGTGKLLLTAAADAPTTDVGIQIFATEKVGNREVTHVAELPSIVRGWGPGFWDYTPSKLHLTVTAPTLFSVDPVAEALYLVRGQSMDFAVKLVRQPGFNQPIKVTAQNLPAGVTVEETELMDEGKQVRLRLKAADSAPKVQMSELIVVGESQADGHKVFESSPKITLKLD